MLTVLFIGLFAVHEHLGAEKLREEAQPKLRIVFEPEGQLYDSLHNSGRLRIFRVGVIGSGASVDNVAVKVARILPELPRVFPMQELQQTHQEQGVSRFTVNKSDEPLVFVDVVHQATHSGNDSASGQHNGQRWTHNYKKGDFYRLWFPFAAGERDFKESGAPPLYEEEYLIWLVIDGAGAEGARKFVLRRNKDGQYDMRLAMFG